MGVSGDTSCADHEIAKRVLTQWDGDDQQVALIHLLHTIEHAEDPGCVAFEAQVALCKDSNILIEEPYPLSWRLPLIERRALIQNP